MGRKTRKGRGAPRAQVDGQHLMKEMNSLGVPFFPKMADGTNQQVCPFCLEVIAGTAAARRRHFEQHDPRRETLRTQEAFKIARGKK